MLIINALPAQTALPAMSAKLDISGLIRTASNAQNDLAPSALSARLEAAPSAQLITLSGRASAKAVFS